jgi:NAD(P)-dependent dehydrogenase (short-subunit alcohol dehydrogenase family)
MRGYCCELCLYSSSVSIYPRLTITIDPENQRTNLLCAQVIPMSFLAAFFQRQLFYTPLIPTASFEGKTVIVTGSNVGLGLEACRWLVRLGASQVILACRNVEKGKAAANDIQTTTSCSPDILKVWQLDMNSYKSVIAFAEKAKSELPRLDAVLANAGIATRTFGTTEDNEQTITTNVVSLSLLGFLLHPKLHETAGKFNTETHLTITASELYEVAKFQERNAPDGKIFATLNDKSTANMADRYNVSKLLEILMVKQMAAMFPLTSSKVIINCVAPGYVTFSVPRKVQPLILFPSASVTAISHAKSTPPPPWLLPS